MGGIFPTWCFNCHRYTTRDQDSESPFLCRKCFESLPFVAEGGCQKCGLGHETEVCDQTWAREIDRFAAIFRYEDPIHHWLVSHKYNRNVLAGRLLRHLVRRWFQQHLDFVSAIDRLIPVPIHRIRLRWRGFNQTAFLLGSQRGLAVDTTVVRKTQLTPHQAGLSREQRLANLQTSFRVNQSLQGESLLLFDDVFTTGQTLGEISRVIKAAGAEQISVLALSRAF